MKFDCDCSGTILELGINTSDGPKQVDELEFTLRGIKGDTHEGFTLTTGPRQKPQYQPGTVVHNDRQWSAISQDALQFLQDTFTVPQLRAHHLGINMLITGIPQLEDLGNLSRDVYFCISAEDEYHYQHESNVYLRMYAQLFPCKPQGKRIATLFGNPSDVETQFATVAQGSRGITGSVHGCKGSSIIRPGYNVHVLEPRGKE